MGIVSIVGDESFPGIFDFESNVGSTPPDPTIAVSAAHVIVVVNSSIAVYERDPGLQPPRRIQHMKLNDFLRVIDTKIPFDVRIIFDPGTDPNTQGRFVMCALSAIDNTNERHAFIAISPPGGLAEPPLDGWTVHSLNGVSSDEICMPGNPDPIILGLDFTGLGYDENAWYVTSLLVSIFATVKGFNASFFIADKQSRPIGQLTRKLATEFLDDDGSPMPCFPYDKTGKFHPYPATPQGIPPAAYFVGVALKVEGDPLCDPGNFEFNVLRIYAIGDPFGVPAYRFTDLIVPCFNADGAPAAPAGPIATISGGDGRIRNVVWREESGVAYLYCAQGMNLEDDLGIRRAIRLLKIRTNDWPFGGAPTLEEAETRIIDAGGVVDGMGNLVPRYLTLPGMTLNSAGDLAVVMQQTSKAEVVSIQAAGRRMANDDLMFPRTLIKASELFGGPNGLGASQQFGDYTTIAPDPDGETFWVIGEYVRSKLSLGIPHLAPEVGLNPGWGTWAAHIRLDPE